MTPPDDLPSPKGLACDSLLKRANEATGLRAAGALVPELLAALESDRAHAKDACLCEVLDAIEGGGTDPRWCPTHAYEAGRRHERNVYLEERESDRALLRRLVEAWDIQHTCVTCECSLAADDERHHCEDCTPPEDEPEKSGLESIIAEARARVGQ